jgi:16S rRNA (uracil1498-N3)-methyltransferase
MALGRLAEKCAVDIRHSPRLYVDMPLHENAALALSDAQAHYLLHVLRARAGDSLRLFNGRDGEWAGTVSGISKRTVTITLSGKLRAAAPTPDLWLCCAPIKKAHFEYMIEKATELGVTVIQPLLTARTQIREVNVERCLSIATEAAEQSERLDIPAIRPSLSLTSFLAQASQDKHLIVCAEWGDAAPVSEAFSALPPNAKAAAIVTGPEGGFAAEELDALRKVPHSVFVRLGPRILRADTAAIAALGCWQAIRGDWNPDKK